VTALKTVQAQPSPRPVRPAPKVAVRVIVVLLSSIVTTQG
jgi:hypothetical protein